MNDLPYRPCAGFMLINANNQVFVGERIHADARGFWQMPQGGIDAGEDPQTAALRELAEETGIAPDQVEIIAGCAEPLAYDLPPELLGKVWGGQYRGQLQHWFLGRFLGSEAEIDLNAHEPVEFRAYRWVELRQLPELIVPFKRAVYEQLVAEFSAFI